MTEISDADWTRLVGGGFAGMPWPMLAPYAAHPKDKLRAKAYAQCLKERGLGRREVNGHLLGFLEIAGVPVRERAKYQAQAQAFLLPLLAR